MTEREEDITGKIARLEARMGLGLRISAEVRAYWEALRAGRLVPDRADVNPRGIDRALEYSFVLERVAPGIGRFRLAGTHLCDVLGMEVRGMPLTAFFVTSSRPQITEATESLFRDPAIIEATLVSEPFQGLPSFSARLLVLPLRSDLGDINRALGCLVAEGDVRRTPTRFEVTTLNMIRVVPPREPESLPERAELRHSPHVSSADPPRGLAEEQAPFHPASKPDSPETRRASFRVVSSDD
ncbi:PAS domain-containing protein [Paenirhodobacter populi]|uniref:PAS domain-containing protein n=1 Tax=Paenirhodobacter populi TaxID=2306993 RepID=A0A443IYN7_9RHOB|nr:PAS domain-containing protein [Sinirhodobacter populi]RWR13265.1 PAS domain-containing protein [Sinirhodobacter populi]